MKTVGVYEAKAQFSRLLEAVERGATIAITRHGKPIAQLCPVSVVPDGREQVIEEIRAFGREHRGALRGLRLKDLIEDGRRY